MNREPITLSRHLAWEQHRADRHPELSLLLEQVAFAWTALGVGPSTAAALRAGVDTPDDPQAGFGPEANRFPAVASVVELDDGEVVRVGDIAITARHIPRHTPGSTAYTWPSCEGDICKDMVDADSLTAVSARASVSATTPAPPRASRPSATASPRWPGCPVTSFWPPIRCSRWERRARPTPRTRSNGWSDA